MQKSNEISAKKNISSRRFSSRQKVKTEEDKLMDSEITQEVIIFRRPSNIFSQHKDMVLTGQSWRKRSTTPSTV